MLRAKARRHRDLVTVIGHTTSPNWAQFLCRLMAAFKLVSEAGPLMPPAADFSAPMPGGSQEGTRPVMALARAP